MKIESATRRALLRGAAALSVTGVGALFAPSASANALRVGAPAPAATLVTLDGQRIATSDLLGRVVILTFWATWCAPCREELPLLSAYATRHAAEGLTVLGFSLDSPEDDQHKVQQVAHSLSFPVGLLANSSLPGYGRIWHIPVNFTINREGQLVDDGWKDKDSTWTPERLERVVTPLLQQGRAPADQPADLQVKDAWIQWLPANVPSAGYMTLINTGSQTRVLVGAVCADYEEASFHQTRERDGMTTMTAVPSIEVKPRSTVQFARGGYHMMLMRPKRALHPGDTVPVTLQFADGHSLVVQFEVRAVNGDGL